MSHFPAKYSATGTRDMVCTNHPMASAAGAEMIAPGGNAIKFDTDGQMTGASCWRADGTPVGLGGG
jgi:hypothetical protein